MKLFLITVASLLALASAMPKKHIRSENKLVGYITRYGYPAESHSVTTEDGYILQLVRIPHGVQNVHSAKLSTDGRRPAVLLFHGFASSSEDFVYGGPTQGLAFYLADHGYDVFLGNARGSIYGQQHTTLDPQKDAAFWRYCFEEIGKKDIPAIIDKVLAVGQQEKVVFIGQGEGATAFFVMAAERPEYADKFERAVTLGPIAFMKKSSHPILEQIVSNHKSKAWVIKNLGSNFFKPSTELVSGLQSECQKVQPKEMQPICKNHYFLFNGYNTEHLNYTTVKEVNQRVPYGGSVRQVLHYAQLSESGRFESFEYDPTMLQSGQSHEYNLEKVRVPVAVLYTPRDLLAHVDDVDTLISKIPNVYQRKVYNSYTNNLELLWGDNVVSVYEDIVDILYKQRGQQNVVEDEI